MRNTQVLGWAWNGLKNDNRSDEQASLYITHVQTTRPDLDDSDDDDHVSASPPPAASRPRRRQAVESFSPDPSRPAAVNTPRNDAVDLVSPSPCPPTATSQPRRQEVAPSSPSPPSSRTSLFRDILDTVTNGHCSFHALGLLLGLGYIEVRAAMVDWCRQHLRGEELARHLAVLDRPADQTCLEFAAHARQAQHFTTDIAQVASNAFRRVIVVEDEQGQRFAFRRLGVEADGPPLGLRRYGDDTGEDGHWRAGILADDADLPPFMDTLGLRAVSRTSSCSPRPPPPPPPRRLRSSLLETKEAVAHNRPNTTKSAGLVYDESEKTSARYQEGGSLAHTKGRRVES